MDMVTTILDNGKLVKPSILTEEDKDENGINDIGEFYKIKKDNVSGKVSVSEPATDWAGELVPTRKSEKKSVIINGLDTKTLCTITEANKIAENKIDEFVKKVSDNSVIDTFRELVDYAAQHQNETLNIFDTLDEHEKAIEQEVEDRKTADNELTTALNQEVEDRKTADNELSTKIDTTKEELTTALNQEAEIRETADKSLTLQINGEHNRAIKAEAAEAKAREEKDTEIENALNDFSTKTNQSISELTTNLNQEIEDRTNQDSVLQAAIIAEAEYRADGDNAEAEARAAADLELNNAIAKEITDRQEDISLVKTSFAQADSMLSIRLNNRITSVETAANEADKALEAKLTDLIKTTATRFEQEATARDEAIEEEATAREEAIAAEAEARTKAIEEELQAREQADDALGMDVNQLKNSLAQEITDRTDAYNSLEANFEQSEAYLKDLITSEEEDRIAKDTELEEKFDNYYTKEETDEEITKAFEEFTDPTFNTVSVKPEEANTTWQAGIKLGELTGKKNLLLFKKSDGTNKTSFLGGELFIEIDDKYIDHHQISLSSNGSYSYHGVGDSLVDSYLFSCKYNNTNYYGISVPSVKYNESNGNKTATITSNLSARFLKNSDDGVYLQFKNTETNETLTTTYLKNSISYYSYCKVWDFFKLMGFTYTQFMASRFNPYKDGYFIFLVKNADGKGGGFKLLASATSYEKGDTDAQYFSDVDFGWNSTYFNTTSNQNYTKYNGTNLTFGTESDDTGWISNAVQADFIIQAGSYYTEGEVDYTTAKLFFNGWKQDNESLVPPESYSDSDLYDIVELGAEETTEITDISGNLINKDSLSVTEQLLLDNPIEEVKITTAQGNTIKTSIINSAKIYTDLCETIDIAQAVNKGQALMAGITFQSLPLKNRMLIDKNTRIYIMSDLDSNFGAFSCQAGIYKLIKKDDGKNYLRMVARTSKGVITHDNNNYFTGSSPYLTINEVNETLLNPAENFYYVGVLSGYRADLVGTVYWTGLTAGNQAPAALYLHKVDSYSSSNLGSTELKDVLCETSNGQLNYIRVVNGE